MLQYGPTMVQRTRSDQKHMNAFKSHERVANSNIILTMLIMWPWSVIVFELAVWSSPLLVYFSRVWLLIRTPLVKLIISHVCFDDLDSTDNWISLLMVHWVYVGPQNQLLLTQLLKIVQLPSQLMCCYTNKCMYYSIILQLLVICCFGID